MDGPQIYAPVAEELRLVEEHLLSLGQSHTASLQDLFSYALGGRGKLMRPAITILASRFHPCDDPRKPRLMASAVELLHLASLIHDDTVDHSGLRRGRSTISSRWGSDVAVLLGDYVFATSATVVCETGNVRVIRRFAETIQEIAQGELAETLGAFDWHQTREQYYERIALKTASLFATAAESGAVLSGAPEPMVQALRTYGMNLGMAFQVIDDILDFQGSQEEMGKPVGNDLLQGTLTLPSLLLVEQHPNGNPIAQFFQGIDRQESLGRVLQMVRGGAIMQASYDIARGFCQEALEALETLEDTPYRRSLQAMASYVLERRR